MRMKISEAASASGCHLETIRYYERIGLMPSPGRTGSGYRDYSHTDVERLRFVTRGRDLGFSLEEIRSLLRLAQDPTMPCGEVDRLARQGLVETSPDPDDRRRLTVALTTAGQALFRDRCATALEVSARTLDHLSAAERDQLLALLSRLA